MPAGLGDIMVIVRAQDFASRTLRRVSGELAGMSRQQALAYQGQLVGLQRMQAAAKMDLALSNQRGLSMIKMKAGLDRQQQAIERYTAAQAAAVAASRDPKGRFAHVPSTLTREVKDAERAMAKYGATAANAATRLQNLRNVGQKLDNAIATLPPRLRRLTAGTAEYNRAISQLRIELSAAGMAVRDVEIAEIAMANALKAAPIARLHDIAGAISGIGRTMQLWGAVGTGIFVLSGVAAANFSRQVTLAATQTRKAGESFTMTAKNADVLQKSILNMMTQFPATAEDMSKAAYDIYSSMDVSFGDGQKLLRMFNKAAVAGQVDLATATSASISVLENFDTTLRDSHKVTARTTQLMNLMFATVRYGRMNFAQFNQMLSSVVPAALNAGQSLEDVAGAMALMTRHVPSQSRAATYLARTLQVLTWRDFQKGMKAFGKPIADAQGHLYDFMFVMRQVHAVAEALGQDYNQLIPIITRVGTGFKTQGREGTQMARYGLGLLVRYFEELVSVQGNVLTDADEFNKAYKAMANTLGVRWQVMINQFKVLILTIGEQALPVLITIGEKIAALVKKWQSLDEGTRKWIVQALTVISVATLLGGVLLAVVGVLTSITAGLLGMLKTFGGPGVESTLLGRAGLFLTTMKGIAGIGSIAIGIDLMFSEHGSKAAGALATAIGIAILGGESIAIPVITVAIAFELFRKGGDWQYLAGILMAAGLVGFRKGIGAGFTAALVTVGLQMVLQGGKWHTLVGSVLLGAALARGSGVAPGITIPVTFAVTWGLQERENEQLMAHAEQLAKQMQYAINHGLTPSPELQKAWDDFMGTGRFMGKEGFIPGWGLIKDIMSGKDIDWDAVRNYYDLGQKEYDAWRKGWEDRQKKGVRFKGTKEASDMARPIAQAHAQAAVEVTKVDRTLRQVIEDQKVETINQALVNQLLKQANQQYEQIASSADIIATKVAAAFSQGKLALANKLIAQFLVTSKGVPLTWANIAKEIDKAMRMKGGGIQAAAAILQQFAQETEQAQQQYEQDMKQWTENMKQWNESLKQTMQSAATTTMNTLRGLYQQITQQNETLMGDLFKGPWLTSQTFDLAKEWGIKPRVQDMIKDMRMQANQFDQIRNLYSTALKKKLPKGFLDQIMQMAPDQALGFLQQLATATPAQVQQIIKLWDRRKNAIKNASKVDFKDSITAYRRAGVDMATAMIEGFGSIEPGKWFNAWIKEKFPNLIDAAVNQAVAQWKKENPVPTKPTGVAGGGGEAPAQPPVEQPKGTAANVNRSAAVPTTPTPKAPKIPPPVVDYTAYKKAGVTMGNNVVRGFHSVHVQRKLQINFGQAIVDYHIAGTTMGAAMAKAVVHGFHTVRMPHPNFRAEIPIYRSGGYRLGVAMANGMINGFQSQHVQEQITAGFSNAAKMFTVGQPKGLLAPGNLDLLHRKAVQVGKDFATVRSISIGTSKGEVLIPTIIHGKAVSNKQAIAHYKKTGENLGTFASVAAANAYANTLHNQQANMVKAGGDTFTALTVEYNAAGRRMGTALNKGVIIAWNKHIPNIQKAVTNLNWNESIIAFDNAGKRLGNAIILGFKQAKVGHFFRTWINETFPKLIDAATTEAVNKWKKEHPNEAKPGKAGGITNNNNTVNNTSTDNRIIITVPENVGPHVKTNARYAAWLAKHHIRPNQVVST